MRALPLIIVAIVLSLRPPAGAQSMDSMPMNMATPKPRSSPAPQRSPKPYRSGAPAAGAAAIPASVSPAAPSLIPGTAHGMNVDGMASGAMAAADMSSAIDRADAMSQEGSGTSWVPKSTQMFGWMQMHGDDMTMEHGAIVPRYVDTGSLRGDRRADAPNWFMMMGTRALGARAQLGGRAMLTADALTEHVTGYPLLFQSGETAHGTPLHDHQHPHDLFSELAVDVSTRIGKSASAYAYVGYPGEPALGPPAFMHRRIAYDLADAPIGHHWMDATHIQFGVATLGWASGSHLKVEASTFTGREPNEIRTNFDPIHLDSYSERLSWNPNDDAAVQVSYAFIKSPEAVSPTVDQHRLTASLLLNRSSGADRNWYNGLVFGENIENTGVRTFSYLAETDYQWHRDAIFARIEFGTRTAGDLALPFARPEAVYVIGSYTVGGVHDLGANMRAAAIGVGAAVTVGSKSATLGGAYGSATPVGFQIFVRARPPDMVHAMAPMSGMSTGNR